MTPKVGQILQVSHKTSGSARVLVLHVESRAKRMLVALISAEVSTNLSRIKLGSGQFVYPSIQATVWLKAPNILDRTEGVDLSQHLTNLIYVWPALTLEEKKARAESAGSGVVLFGEKGNGLTAVLVQEIGVLQKLSMRLLRNSMMPPQLSPKLFAKTLLTSSSQLPVKVIDESSFAFFAGTSLAHSITSHLEKVGEGHDIYRSLLIRKSTHIRSTNNLKGARKNLLINAQSFMEEAGLDFMQVLASKDEASELRSNSDWAKNKNITVRSLRV